jgi:hypothetical protein
MGAVRMAGSATTAKIPMMATTTISSISVKPRCLRDRIED